MTANQILFRSLTTLGLLATTLTAQGFNFDTTRGNSASFNSGDASLGGSLTFSAFATAEFRALPPAGRLEIGGNLAARARMFGANVEAASVRASWGASSRTSVGIDRTPIRVGAASFVVRLAGFEVINVTDPSLARSLPPLNVFGPNGVQVPIPVGPFVVTVAANAGITASFGISGNIDLGRFAISVTASMRNALVGTARVAVGVLGAKVGVIATLNILDTTTALTAATSSTRPSGIITITTRPVRLFLEVFAEVPLLPRFTHPVYDYSMAASTRTYGLI